ncbi:MAG: ferritin family protein [bacterium]
MTQKNDLASLFATAIRRERDAAIFYQQIMERVANPAAKAVFAQLVKDENEHERFLEKCQVEPSLLADIDPHWDCHLATATDLPPLSIDMKPADAIALAMKKEQEAVDFYRMLAAKSADGKTKVLFNGLAKMELSHKNQLESVFTAIGYPEVF